MVCLHCPSELYSESEQRRRVCRDCYSFGLKYNHWPLPLPSISMAQDGSQDEQSNKSDDTRNNDND